MTKLVLTFILIFVAAFTISSFENKDDTGKVEQNTELNDLCLLKRIQSGDNISEAAPGFYEYTLIQTSEGIEVWVPCSRR